MAHDNRGASFGYGCCISSYSGHDVRGLGEACKHIQCSLLHFARVRCFTSSAVKSWGYESKWLPSRTLMSSRTISCCLLAFFLAPEERENERDIRDRISLAALHYMHWGKSRR
jgi:hypothetical protein